MDHKDITIYRGDDCEFLLTFDSGNEPFTLVGARVDMHMRGQGATLKLSTQTGNLTVLSDKELLVRITHADTQDLRWKMGEYDLQITVDNKINTLLRGRVNLTHDITIVEAP